MELARRGERQVGVEGAEVGRKGFGVMVGSEMMGCRGGKVGGCEVGKGIEEWRMPLPPFLGVGKKGSSERNCRGRVGVGRKTSKRRESGKQVEKYKEKVMEPRYP